MRKIALFGTSADPPTAGHQNVLKWLSDRYDLVAVWASDNPFKEHQTPLEHRKTMLRLLIEEISTPRKNVKLYEELSHLRSLVTLEKAKIIWGNEVEYTLVIGSDLVSQVPRWYHSSELLSQVKILIIPRPGYPLQEKDLSLLKHLGGKYVIANLDGLEVSSTAYRTKKDKTVLTKPVKDYIIREKLYA